MADPSITEHVVGDSHAVAGLKALSSFLVSTEMLLPALGVLHACVDILLDSVSLLSNSVEFSPVLGGLGLLVSTSEALQLLSSVFDESVDAVLHLGGEVEVF